MKRAQVILALFLMQCADTAQQNVVCENYTKRADLQANLEGEGIAGFAAEWLATLGYTTEDIHKLRTAGIDIPGDLKGEALAGRGQDNR